eukprot:Gregarina_sp_Pseudo_9__313@NODE_1202_length_1784_cov_16_976504_g1128_i0_p1_GENE_NODE_1202_length_1784_cov_16_976504_g1128_i0NODE_1202_length_1784_cov_16_976504_g1128_i0_p1_ORF_typecomplete_len579_score74_12_NODE_1202_length_1784_cov_16_976504_g1128_i0151751
MAVGDTHSAEALCGAAGDTQPRTDDLCAAIARLSTHPSPLSLLVTLQEALACTDKEASRTLLEAGLWDLVIHALSIQNLQAFVLMWLEEWLLEQVESYDHTLGTMSKLSYFLTERDIYSVDICWGWREAKRMTSLSKVLIEMVVALDESLKPRALRILSLILLECPPSRVNPALPGVLVGDVKRLRDLVAEARAHLPVCEFTDFLLGFGALGLGTEFMHIFCTSAQQFHLSGLLMPGHRCSCSFCELVRRTRKAAKLRDEFGIEAAFASLRTVLPALRKADALQRVKETFETILLESIRETSNSNDEALLKLTGFIQLARVADPSLVLSDWISLESLGKWLQEFPFMAHHRVSEGGFGSGLRAFLVLVCQSLTPSLPSAVEGAHRPLYDALETLLLDIANATVEFLGTRQDKPFTFRSLTFAPLFAWLLATVDIATRRASEDLEGLDCQGASEWENTTSQLARHRLVTQALDLTCQTCLNTDLSEATDIWKKEIFTALCFALATVCDCYSHFRVSNELRRKVLTPPHKEAGLLLASVRKLAVEYNSLFPSEGCTVIKGLVNACTYRAELANAIQAGKI